MRIRLLREAGGLGDVVRCLGVARAVKKALKRRGEPCELWFYTLHGYVPLAELAPDVDRVVGLSRLERRGRDELPDPRRHAYLRSGRPFDCTVDLFCPPFRYERHVRGEVKLDRLECWTAWTGEKIGIPLAPTLARLALPEYVKGRAAGWLEQLGLAKWQRGSRPLVALQPLSAGKQRSLTWSQTREIAAILKAAGCRVLFFHTRREPGDWAGELDLAGAIAALGVPAALGVDVALLAALVAECDVIVSGDSGLFHIAAVTGTPAVAAFGLTSGRIMRKHYPLHAALEAGAEERREFPCGEVGRACYAFGPATRGPECLTWGCCAARIPAERIAAMALVMLGRADEIAEVTCTHAASA